MADRAKMGLKSMVYAGIIGLALVGGAREARADLVPFDSNSIVKDYIEYYMQTDKSIYDLGENVQMLYRVTNLGVEDVTFEFLDQCQYHFTVKDNGNLVWFAPKAGMPAFSSFTLQPNGYKEYSENWDMINENGTPGQEYDDFPANPGSYEVTGSFHPISLLDKDRYVPVSVQIEIIPVNSNSVVKDYIEYYMQTDKPVYDLGENVQMSYRVTNLGDQKVTIGWVPADPLAHYNFRVMQDGAQVWRYPYITPVMGFEPFYLWPHASRGFSETWNMMNDNGTPWQEYDDFPVGPGLYNVVGELRLMPRVPVSVSVEIIPEPIAAWLDIDPNTLNLASGGKWITCYIWLPEEHDVADIDPNSVRLENEPNAIEVEWIWFEEEEQVAMARFNRSEVQEMIEPGDVELTVSGELIDGTRFEGIDTIKVISKGRKKK